MKEYEYIEDLSKISNQNHDELKIAKKKLLTITIVTDRKNSQYTKYINSLNYKLHESVPSSLR